MQGLSFWARDRILAPCGGRRVSNPWTARAVPAQLFFKAGCTLEGEASTPSCHADPSLCSPQTCAHLARLHRQGGPARPPQTCPSPPAWPAASPRSPGTPVPSSRPRAPRSGLSFLETQFWDPLRALAVLRCPRGPRPGPGLWRLPRDVVRFWREEVVLLRGCHRASVLRGCLQPHACACHHPERSPVAWQPL